MNQTDGVVLKTDKRGRVQTSAARRNEVFDAFEKSGLSGMKFAELAGVKYQTLATWVKKRRDQPLTAAEQTSESMRQFNPSPKAMAKTDFAWKAEGCLRRPGR